MECHLGGLSIKPGGGDDVVHAAKLRDGSLLAILADGATGSGSGQLASRLFVEMCVATVDSFDITTQALVALFLQADASVAALNQYCDTTGILFLVKDGNFVCASVGDSEARMLDGEQDISLTVGQLRKPRIGSGCRPPAICRGTLTGPVILMSDGLMMAASWDTVRTAVLHAPDPIDTLLQPLRDTRLHDDLSLIVIRP